MLKLHDYQREAVEHLRSHPRAGLFLEMGLGKTAVVLSALRPEHLPALVIAPRRVACEVWPTELRKWRPELSYSLAHGSAAKRAQALATVADVHIISVDNAADAIDGPAYATIVLDELSLWKNRNTRRWGTASKITAGAPHVWGLTGTPIPKGYIDLWAQIFLIDGGERLGRYITHYRERFFVQTPKMVKRSDGSEKQFGSEYTLRDGAAGKINSRISDIVLAQQIEGRLDLVRPTTNDVVVPLPPKARRAYERMRESKAATIGGATFSSATAAVVSNKLAQITAGVIYPDDHDMTGEEPVRLHTAKAEAIREISEGTGSPLLVFYRYKHELAMLRGALPEARSVDEPGVMDDWNRGEVPIMLMQPQSAGHGLNLQAGGHTIVWASMCWSPEVYKQANARLFRQGQERRVVIHRLLVPDSIDGHMVDVVEGRASIEQALMDHLDPAGAIARALEEMI